MSRTLAAWDAFDLAHQAHKGIGFHVTLSDEPDWKLYWLAGIASLRAIGHVLRNQDAKRNPLLTHIVGDFWQHSAFRNSPIFIDFIENERNDILKEFRFGASTYKYTLAGFADTNLTYDEKVALHGEFEGLMFGEDGEDALRLYEIALIKWHQELTTIEQAMLEKEATPYSKGHRKLTELRQASPLTLQGLKLETPRL